MSRYSATGLKPQACPFCGLPQLKPGTDDAECANGHQWHPLTTERWPASCEACPETTRCADQAPGPGHGRCILRLVEEAKAQGAPVEGGVTELIAWIIAQGEEAAAQSGSQAPRSASELADYWEQQAKEHGSPHYLGNEDLREIVAALRAALVHAECSEVALARIADGRCGCTNSPCEVQRPEGQHTNGACHCLDELPLDKRARVRARIRQLERERDAWRRDAEQLAQALRRAYRNDGCEGTGDDPECDCLWCECTRAVVAHDGLVGHEVKP